MTTKNLQYESGRSMVEMLGTLAVIGVLSIGGIAGYSYSMDKYRANETINDINLRGIDLVRQVSMGQEPSLAEWGTKSTVGYTFSDAQLSAEGDAYFTVSGVPKRVCEIIYEGIQNNQTTDVEVNEATNRDASDCHKDDDNVMGFFFITNAGEGGKTPEDLCKNKTCPEGYSCTHGICMSEEQPQAASDWKMCTSSHTCGICEQCTEWTYDFYCEPLADGTSCGTGKECQKGQCIENKTCTDNSNCDNNHYCGHLYDMHGSSGISDSKTCLFAEFYKVPLSDGDYFYISQHKNIRQDAEAMCEAVGMILIENFTDRIDVFNKINRVEVISKTEYCPYRSLSYCTSISETSLGYVVCVKENKTYNIGE